MMIIDEDVFRGRRGKGDEGVFLTGAVSAIVGNCLARAKIVRQKGFPLFSTDYTWLATAKAHKNQAF